MSKLAPLAAVLLLVLMVACVATSEPVPEGEANKAVVRDYLERLLNRGEMDAWPELVAGDTLTFNGQVMTRDQLEQMRATFFTILPDMHVTVEEQIAEGDIVASRVTITGTHLGEFMGLGASGKELSFGGITYDRFADGKVVEAWHEMNLWGTLLMASDE